MKKSEKQEEYKNKSLEYYMSLDYKRHIVELDAERISIIYPQLPGCMSIVSPEEDIESASQQLLENWFCMALTSDYKIPEPY